MKFTVAFITLLSISSTWAVLAKEDAKDKREAAVGYPAPSSGHSSSSASSYQAPSLNHGDASSISVGAGYSIGGAKPAYSFGGQGSAGALQYQSEGLPANGHATIQLAPITLQPNHGLVGTDLSQIMSQLQHSFNSGALTLQPSNTVAEFHQTGHGDQQASYPQLNYGSQQYSLAGSISSAPAYSAGTKGLSSYSSTGPVLFNPAESHANSAALAAAPSAGHSLGDSGSLSYASAGNSLAGLSLGGSGHSFSAPEVSLGSSPLSLNGLAHSLGSPERSLGGSGHSLGSSGLSLGGSGHSFGGAGLSLGGSGHSLGGPAYSLGGSGHSLGGHSFGGSSHSFGGSPNSIGAIYKVSGSSYGHGAPSKSAFKPSTFLGASVQSESGHSGSHGFPSFSSGSHGLSLSSHGPSFGGSFGGFGGSSKGISPLYSKGFGSAGDSTAAYSSAGHLATPPGTTYGFPTASYPAGAVHAASSGSPQYYISSSKFPSSFGEGSSSYKSPISSHSSLNSHSSGPKYSFGGHSSSGSRYASPKDSHGSHSEAVYNTIKYSEELKPRGH